MEFCLLCDAVGCCTSTLVVERIDPNSLDVQTHSEAVARRWFYYRDLPVHWSGDGMRSS